MRYVPDPAGIDLRRIEGGGWLEEHDRLDLVWRALCRRVDELAGLAVPDDHARAHPLHQCVVCTLDPGIARGPASDELLGELIDRRDRELHAGIADLLADVRRVAAGRPEAKDVPGLIDRAVFGFARIEFR